MSTWKAFIFGTNEPLEVVTIPYDGYAERGNDHDVERSSIPSVYGVKTDIHRQMIDEDLWRFGNDRECANSDYQRERTRAIDDDRCGALLTTWRNERFVCDHQTTDGNGFE